MSEKAIKKPVFVLEFCFEGGILKLIPPKFNTEVQFF